MLDAHIICDWARKKCGYQAEGSFVFKIKFKKGMEVEYKMGDMLKVYYDGHTSGLYWPIDVMMTPGISGVNILSKSPRNL